MKKLIDTIGILLLCIGTALTCLMFLAMLIYFWWVIPLMFFVFLPAMLLLETPSYHSYNRKRKNKRSNK